MTSVRIGLTPYLGPVGPQGIVSYYLKTAYLESVEQAGGLPVLLPLSARDDVLDGLLDTLDGLLLTGGYDVDPQLFGEAPHQRLGQITPERDRAEMHLVLAAVERGMPVLGICRGLQLMAVAFGGRLHQDIPSAVPAAIKHAQDAPRYHRSHSVTIASDSILARLVCGRKSVSPTGGERIERRVNSFHHQAVSEPPPGWRVTALAPDGVIEALERPGDGFLLGVQWHPEDMWNHPDHDNGLFVGLVEAARAYAGRRGVSLARS